MSALDPLHGLTERLEQTATRLRADDLQPEDAAKLVEECARLAGDAVAELDRRVRAAADTPPVRVPGQTDLLS